MNAFVINGGKPLVGEVRVRGAKNATLPLMAAAILADGPCRLTNVPDLRDVATMTQILRELGMRVERVARDTLELETLDPGRCHAPYDLVSQMRASICVLGPLLAGRGRARVAQPGGCAIGVRPIDLHVKGLRALGARVETEHGDVVADAGRLRGAEVSLRGPHGSTVLGTCNTLCAAVLAEGATRIHDAACEPEVQEVARFLAKMGARIEGIGTPQLTVEGVASLRGAEHEIIPDRIEAGTFLTAGAITRGDILVHGVQVGHLQAVGDALTEIGVCVAKEADGCRVTVPGDLRAADLTTAPYPGLPTDMQAQLMALLAVAKGTSVVTEGVFPERFMHVAELNRMSAHIRKDGPRAIVQGVPHLSGAPVMASDLRASAGLVLAGLAAHGATHIARVYHIDRGYERIEERMAQLGADILRVNT